MSGGMQRHSHAVDVDRIFVVDCLQRDCAKPRAQNVFGCSRCQVTCVPRACVIAMGVRDNRPVDFAPGIDIEVARRAVQPLGTGDDQRSSRSFATKQRKANRRRGA